MIVTNSGKVIIISQDGSTPDTVLVKTNISDIRGIFVEGSASLGVTSNPSMPYNRPSQTKVEFSMSDGQKIQIDVQDVSSPSGWNAGTQAALNTAVNALIGYL